MSKSWSPNLRRHLSKLKRGKDQTTILKRFSSLLHRRRIILFIRSQKLLSFRRIHKSSDCWQVSWIKYGSLNILILLHVNSSWYKYFLEIWIWIWKWNLGNVFCENSTCYIISSCTGIYWDFLLTQQLNVTWMWPKILKNYDIKCNFFMCNQCQTYIGSYICLYDYFYVF